MDDLSALGLNQIGSLSPFGNFGYTDGLIGLAATLLKLIIGKDRGRQPHISTHAGASDRE
jgi:hypothetical protein